MSWIFLKRFLSRPFQVASVIPSSSVIIKMVSDKMDFSEPRVIAELGPGEGSHTREILKRLQPGSKLLLFELDPELAAHLNQQFQKITGSRCSIRTPAGPTKNSRRAV